MSFDPAARRRANQNYWVDKEREASRYFWAGVVLALIGVLWFASIPWLDWLGYGLGFLFFFSGMGLVLKWRRILMTARLRRRLWADYVTDPNGIEEPPEDTINSETICIGSNGTHDNRT